MMPLLIQGSRENFVIWRLLTYTSKIKNEMSQERESCKMFHMTDVFYWGNPNPEKSSSFTPYTSTY